MQSDIKGSRCRHGDYRHTSFGEGVEAAFQHGVEVVYRHGVKAMHGPYEVVGGSIEMRHLNGGQEFTSNAHGIVLCQGKLCHSRFIWIQQDDLHGGLWVCVAGESGEPAAAATSDIQDANGGDSSGEKCVPVETLAEMEVIVDGFLVVCGSLKGGGEGIVREVLSEKLVAC